MRLLIAAMLSAGLLAPMAAHAEQGLTVFAAASLTDAFNDIGNLWHAKGHPNVTFNFAASSTLATQIEHGAPANVFASADELWMDKLAKDHRIKSDSRVDIVGNTLVVVELKAHLKPISLKPGVNFDVVLGPDGRLAVGDPSHVPAGIYAEQALRKLGAWNRVHARLAPADSVRSALLLVSHGEAPAGIVYATDVAVAPGLGVAGVFPADSHDPIRYPVAVTRRGATAEAAAFVAFLQTEPARDVFRHYGFTPP